MSVPSKARVGRTIRAARRERGYSQEHLAELVEVSVQALSSIEGGSSMPRGGTLLRLMVVLDLERDDLIKKTKAWRDRQRYPKQVAALANLLIDAPEDRVRVIASIARQILKME